MTKREPHDLGHRQRLRERFQRSGLDGLADYEVVELLLSLAIPRSDVKQPAKAWIERFGDLRGILDAPLDEVRAVNGIGSVAPVALQIIRAAATLYLQQSAEGRDSLADPDHLATFWRMQIGALNHEVFQVGYLDSGYRLLRHGIETLEEGTIDRAAVYPRRVIESALRSGAAALVLAHNHPNGDVRPSEQDKVLTRALVLAAETVQVKILDGPLLVVAGPGSGKTYCIVLRALNLLLLGRAAAREVILCTFTQKAAFEMRDMLATAARMVGYDGDLSELYVSTIHGLCNRLLMEHRHRTELGHNYETLDELTQLLFIFEHFDEIHRSPTGRTLPRPMADALDRDRRGPGVLRQDYRGAHRPRGARQL